MEGPTLGQSPDILPDPAQFPSLTINGFSHSIFSFIGFPGRLLSAHPIAARPQLIPVPAVNHHNPWAFSNTVYGP